MSGQTFRIFQCSNPSCAFRCPQTPTDRELLSCPKCGSLGESKLYELPGHESLETRERNAHPVVEVLLDNLRSTFNVGSVFRTADGSGIQKTGLGAEWEVPWESISNGLHLIETKKDQGYRIWALESISGAESLFDARLTPLDYPILLIIGNEKVGVDPEILEICDKITFIPMVGYKRSLNVANAFGIAAYYISGFLH
jgi:23S rRNA (guanosine2251-2'-O)-methyltransferase